MLQERKAISVTPFRDRIATGVLLGRLGQARIFKCVITPAVRLTDGSICCRCAIPAPAQQIGRLIYYNLFRTNQSVSSQAIQ